MKPQTSKDKRKRIDLNQSEYQPFKKKDFDEQTNYQDQTGILKDSFQAEELLNLENEIYQEQMSSTRQLKQHQVEFREPDAGDTISYMKKNSEDFSSPELAQLKRAVQTHSTK